MCFLFLASPRMLFGQPAPTEKEQGSRVLTVHFSQQQYYFVGLFKITNTA